MNKIDLITNDEFIKLVESCSCISDVLRKLNYSVEGNSWAYTIVKERIKKLNCHFGNKKNSKSSKRERLPLSEIMTVDSSYNRTKLKERLVKEGLKEYKCECCGISEWQGKPISLQLHHINGINNDHRLSNLQLLCPNCHSQTENFGTKGKGTAIIRKAESLPVEDIERIMNTVREVGIVEARKILPYRNSLINTIVKNNRDVIIVESLDGSIMKFATTLEAARFLVTKCKSSVETLRGGISKCCSGRQKTIAGGYKCYRKGAQEHNS